MTRSKGADEDTQLMAKEALYSMLRMSSRLGSKSELLDSHDETHVCESINLENAVERA